MFKKKIPKNSKFYFNDNEEIDIEDEDNTLSDYKVNNKKIIKITPSISDKATVDTETKNYELSEEEEDKNKVIPNCSVYETLKDFTIYLYEGKEFSDEEEKNCRTFMVVGQTGSGKTTFLNALINYYLNVDFDSNIRYILVDEKDIEKENKNSGISKTRDVKYYYLRGNNEQPLLKVIDTPGFGDTRGIDKDRITIEAIRKLFEKDNFQSINAICFVVQSGINKLSKSQSYVFNQVLSLFGEDLKGNFIAIITFSNMIENNQPSRNVLLARDSGFSSVAPHLKDPWCFLYDNSCIFKKEGKKGIWTKAMENYKKFIDKLCNLNYVTLKQTKDVIDKRRIIECEIEILSKNLKQGTFLLESFRRVSKQLERQKIAINKGINFQIEKETLEPIRIPLKKGTYTTKCFDCDYTCHEVCWIVPNDSDENKRHCAAMRNDYCKHCPKKCIYKVHHNCDHTIDWKVVKTKIELDELKKKYASHMNVKNDYQRIQIGTAQDFADELIKCLQMVKKIQNLLRELNSICLNKNQGESFENYVKLLIEVAEREKEYGWEQRVAGLNKLLDTHSLMQKIHKNQGVTMSYEDFEKEALKNGVKIKSLEEANNLMGNTLSGDKTEKSGNCFIF